MLSRLNDLLKTSFIYGKLSWLKKSLKGFISLLSSIFFLVLSGCSFQASLNSLEGAISNIIPVQLSSSVGSPTNEDEIPVTLTFGVDVSEIITKDHLQVTGGFIKNDVINESLAGRAYSFVVVPSGDGTVQVHFPKQKIAIPQEVDLRFASSSSLNVVVDRVEPTVLLSSSASNPTGLGVIPITVTFNESVTGLSSSDFDVLGATGTLVAGSGSVYTLNLVPTSLQSNIEVQLPSGSVKDLAGNNNAASNVFTLAYDGRSPVPTLATVAGNPTALDKIPVTVTFDHPVTGLTASDFTVTNGSVVDFTGSGSSYTFNIANSDDGAVSVLLPAGRAQGLLGVDNVASNTLTINVNRALDPLTIAIGTPAPLMGDMATVFVWTVTYSGASSVSLNSSHVTLSGDATGCVASILGSGLETREVRVTGCSGHSDVGISIAAGTAENDAGTAAVAAGPSQTVKVSNSILVNFAKSTSFVEKTAGNETHHIPFSLDRALEEDVNISYWVSTHATAVNPINYDLPSAGFVTIPKGQTAGNISYNYVGASSGSQIVQVALDVKSNNGYNFKSASPLHRRLVQDALEPGYEDVSTKAHSCVIRTGGALYCWGDNGRGQLGDGTTVSRTIPTLIDGANTYESVNVGTLHTCGIRTGGALYCWGENGTGQLGDGTTGRKSLPTLIDGGNTYASISADISHSCGIRTDGALYCWGANSYNQLGDGTTTSRLIPTLIDSGHAYLQVSAGSSYTCGIRADSTLYCWGINTDRQLGDGTSVDRTVPTLINSGNTYIQVSTGVSHSCGIRTGGSLYCWGSNLNGRLGDGTTSSKAIPTLIDSANTYTNISTGLSHTCGVRTSGALYCWGHNQERQLGDGTSSSRTSPTLIDGDHTYTTVVAGNYRNCGIRTSGGVYCWGKGILGDGTADVNPAPIAINSDKTYTSVSSGGTHTCGIRSDGFLYCWGGNTKGQLGDGTIVSKSVPMPIDNSHTYVQVSAGGNHTCGIRTGGSLYCWGANGSGQLGDGTTADRLIRVAVDSANTYISISAGDYHTCGIRTGGALYCWGHNSSNQLGDGTLVGRSIPTLIDEGNTYTNVSIGLLHTCGLRTSGFLYCWGSNTTGQLGDGTAVSRSTPVAIDGSNTYTNLSVGGNTSCGVRTGGALYCWGSNVNGQLGDGTDMPQISPKLIDNGNNYSSINAGGTHTCGIRTNGSVYCWGFSYDGQVGETTGDDKLSPDALGDGFGYSSLELGKTHTCGIRTDGSLHCWGSNTSGQIGDDHLMGAITPVQP